MTVDSILDEIRHRRSISPSIRWFDENKQPRTGDHSDRG